MTLKQPMCSRPWVSPQPHSWPKASTWPLLSSSGIPVLSPSKSLLWPQVHQHSKCRTGTCQSPAPSCHSTKGTNPPRSQWLRAGLEAAVWPEPAGAQPGTLWDTAGSKHVLLRDDKRSIFGGKSTSAVVGQLRADQPLPVGASLRSGEHREQGRRGGGHLFLPEKGSLGDQSHPSGLPGMRASSTYHLPCHHSYSGYKAHRGTPWNTRVLST